MVHFERNRAQLNYSSGASTTWIFGKKHIFLSEGARQQLELVRNERRILAATLIQTIWRGYVIRRKLPYIRQNLIYAKAKFAANNCALNIDPKLRPPRPQPITGTPPPFGNQIQPNNASIPCYGTNKSIELYDFNIVRETCALLGLDLVSL